eukprot:gene23214-27840_t
MAAQERIRWEATILHADHGPQFTSWGFGENLRRFGLLESFGTVGDCFDNAVMEAFWGRLQTELLNTKKWSTTLELTAAMADHIDNFHNGERRHSYLGNISPIEHPTVPSALIKLVHYWGHGSASYENPSALIKGMKGFISWLDIIRKLRHGDELAAKGTDVEEIARQLDVSVPTLYNWRKQYGGMKADDAKEFKELKNENALLKKLLAEAELEKAALKEIAKGKF